MISINYATRFLSIRNQATQLLDFVMLKSSSQSRLRSSGARGFSCKLIHMITAGLGPLLLWLASVPHRVGLYIGHHDSWLPLRPVIQETEKVGLR